MSIKKRIKINSEKEYYAVLNKLKEMGYEYWGGTDFPYDIRYPITHLYIDGMWEEQYRDKCITYSTNESYAPDEPYVDWVPVVEDITVCKDFIEVKPTPKYYEYNGKKYLLEEVEMIFNKLLKPIEDA